MEDKEGTQDKKDTNQQKVVSIGAKTFIEPNDELIQELEDLLILAKEGDIKSFAYVGLGNGITSSDFILEEGANAYELLGAISSMGYRFEREVMG
jgi:hypothetical protein